MKIYEKQDVDNSFIKAIKAMESEGIKAEDLSIYFGSLTLTIDSRLHQLKNGIAKSISRDKELIQLQEAANCLTAKINSDSVTTMSQQIMSAYKVYATNH
ncbi:hypothetical protein [Pseudoalteromonas tetraodonis]|uniref:hypothetical protein n=1 Tax=Pseudoalteromonas tetraodonis TaxID=43659 RepID=UPI003735C11B